MSGCFGNSHRDRTMEKELDRYYSETPEVGLEESQVCPVVLNRLHNLHYYLILRKEK
jgi:hypothetical protein